MAKKLTVEEFENRAKEIHKGKYVYHQDFLNTRGNIVITCPKYGYFIQTPKRHLKGQGCPECGKEFAKQCQKGKYEEFIKRANEKFGERFTFPNISEEYENKFSEITICCNKCGNTYRNINSYFLSSPYGNCDCETKNITYEELSSMTDANNIVPFEGQRLKYHDKVELICEKHGKYECYINSVIKGNYHCRKCAISDYVERKKVTVSKFKEKILEKWGDCFETDFSEYEDYNSKLVFKCKTCGSTFKREARACINGYMKIFCSVCSKEKQTINATKTTMQFIEDMNTVYPNGGI